MSTKITDFRRNTARGKVFGVCAGLADYSGIDAIWWRIGAVLLALSSGGIAILAYGALGIFTPNTPSAGGR